MTPKSRQNTNKTQLLPFTQLFLRVVMRKAQRPTALSPKESFYISWAVSKWHCLSGHTTLTGCWISWLMEVLNSLHGDQRDRIKSQMGECHFCFTALTGCTKGHLEPASKGGLPPKGTQGHQGQHLSLKCLIK